MTKPEPIFIDTWGWLAMGHRRDQYHQQVKALYQTLRSSQTAMHTSDYILDELMTLLFKREVFQEAVLFMEGIFKATELGQIQIHRITSNRFQAAWELRKQFQDKPLISFTDLTSMVLMRELGIQQVLTQDEHFLQTGMAFRRIP